MTRDYNLRKRKSGISYKQALLNIAKTARKYKTKSKMCALNYDLSLKIIPEFKGNPSELHRFLACCEIIHKPLKLETEESKFLELLKARVSGKAYDVIKFNKYETWETLKREFIKQFGMLKSPELLQVELVTIEQHKHESIRDYGNRTETLLSQLDESSILEQGEDAKEFITKFNAKTALKAFQEGLLDPIKILVKSCRFGSLGDAINKACEEESTLKNSRKRNQPLPALKSTVSCQICGKSNHSANVCFKRIPNNSTHSNKISSQTQNFRTVNNYNCICAYCKKRGHHIRDCFAKKRADDRKNAISQNNLENSELSKSGNFTGLENTRNTPTRVQNLESV